MVLGELCVFRTFLSKESLKPPIIDVVSMFLWFLAELVYIAAGIITGELSMVFTLFSICNSRLVIPSLGLGAGSRNGDTAFSLPFTSKTGGGTLVEVTRPTVDLRGWVELRLACVFFLMYSSKCELMKPVLEEAISQICLSIIDDFGRISCSRHFEREGSRYIFSLVSLDFLCFTTFFRFPPGLVCALAVRLTWPRPPAAF